MRNLTINLPRGIDGVVVDMDKLSETMIDNLVAFALQSRITNAFASMPESKDYTLEHWTDEAHRHVAEAEDGSMRFGTGGGGARLDTVEIECRAIVRDARVRKGEKIGEATKAAVKWRAGQSPEAIGRVVALAEKAVALKGIDIELDL